MGRLDGVRSDNRRGSLSGEAMVLHDERRAEQLLKEGLTRLGLSAKDLDSQAKGSDEKRVLAWYIRESTMVSNEWLSGHLRCGHPANIPGYLRSVRSERDRKIKQLKVKILKSED